MRWMKVWRLIPASLVGTAIFVVLVSVTSCAGLDAARDAGERARGGEEAPGSSTGSGEEEAQQSDGSSSASEPVLEDRYYQDSDGNAIPDFIEVERGDDPELDDCAMEGGCESSASLGESRLLDEQNVLLILDSSGSMAEQDSSGTSKIDAARWSVTWSARPTPSTSA